MSACWPTNPGKTTVTLTHMCPFYSLITQQRFDGSWALQEIVLLNLCPGRARPAVSEESSFLVATRSLIADLVKQLVELQRAGAGSLTSTSVDEVGLDLLALNLLILVHLTIKYDLKRR